MGIDPTPPGEAIGKGLFKIVQETGLELRLFYLLQHMDVAETVEILEGPHILYEGVALKIMGIGLDGVDESGGQTKGGLDAFPLEVFGQDGCRGRISVNPSRRPASG